MTLRFGFGDETESDGDTAQYENGHVDVSRAATDHIMQEHGDLPPVAGLAAALVEGTDYEITRSDG